VLKQRRPAKPRKVQDVVQARDKALPLEALRARFEEHGQRHVVAALDALGGAGRARLSAQLAAVDPAALARAFAGARRLAEGPRERLEPPEIERLPEHGGDAGLREQARRRGFELLSEGAVAALVVAGGQGSRLGFAGPKGLFPLGPVSERSLFEQQAQKLRGAAGRHGRPVPWLVMTSPATDRACREAFEAAGRYGLPAEDVRFFTQGTLPSVDFEGRLLLEAPDRLAEAPDGHGGVIPALVASGLLDELEARGIRFLSYYQVDNPLVTVVDPLFLGLHDLRAAEMSCKVLAKRGPEERAGTVGRCGGRTRVIEYTEVDPWHRDQRDARGQLVYWAASIGIHVLSTAFVRRVAAEAERVLPYHASAKAIPCLGPDGRRVVPEAPNGYKLERFVFDALPEARRVALLEVRRHEEYSPIKNRSGGESPGTARRDLVARYREWLRRAGGKDLGEDAWIELDESRIGAPETFEGEPGLPAPGADWILFGNRGIA
jgi:UDP-N-acetylglucosamine/UDP-N-acetylgalactosamine diphosphorylase